ncbi:MAG: type II toxin-antitoxin system RelE/ParE family toxin [Clostridiales bacterium]|nr:type II toxin-antitoxin system RelE/ParE family toxin [Clostridiales bacterium]
MDKYRIELAEAAKRDLREMHAYITDNLSEPILADKLLDKIETEILTLQQMPKRYALERDNQLKQRSLRKLIVENYLVIYTVHDNVKAVYIARILYNRRDWRNLL